MTARSTKKRSNTATSVSNEYADEIIEKNVANEEKYLDILSVMAASKASKASKAEEKKELTATEKVIERLTKMVITFPMKDQLEMTNQISQIVHARALQIEMRPKKT